MSQSLKPHLCRSAIGSADRTVGQVACGPNFTYVGMTSHRSRHQLADFRGNPKGGADGQG